MIRCPKCGTILKGDENQCGVCGADLSQARDQPLDVAVKEEEALKAESEEELRKKAVASVRKLAILGIAVYVATATLIGSGLWLAIHSSPSSLTSFTPFTVGFWLVWCGFMMLIFVVIGARPGFRGGGR